MSNTSQSFQSTQHNPGKSKTFGKKDTKSFGPMAKNAPTTGTSSCGMKSEPDCGSGGNNGYGFTATEN